MHVDFTKIYVPVYQKSLPEINVLNEGHVTIIRRSVEREDCDKEHQCAVCHFLLLGSRQPDLLMDTMF